MKQSYKQSTLSFICVLLLMLLDTNFCRAGDSNKCTTYSCGVCCSHDTRACCNPGFRRPSLRSDVPINRTYTKNNTSKLLGITITEADITATLSGGKTHLSNTRDNYLETFSMDIGNADNTAPQSWVIPNSITTFLNYQDRINFIVSTEVPASVSTTFAAQGLTATHWAKETVEKNGIPYTCYHFLDVGQMTPGLNNLGKVYMRNSDGQVFFDNSVLSASYTDIPINLDSNYPIFSNYLDPENAGFKKYYQGNITYDAYGTIATPYGTFSCLRGSYTLESQLYDANGNGIGTPDISHWVIWTTREGFRFYGRKPSENASGTVNLANVELIQVVETSVLPIELLKFEALRTEPKTVKIKWQTASEKDNALFEVQRTTDGKNFETVGTVRGVVNSTQTQSYELTDNHPSVGHNYYRLRQTDTNGNETFSPLEYVWIVPDKGFFNVYPNPANAILNVEFEKAKDMEITDALGKTIQSIKIDNGLFLQKQTISIQDLPNGIYFLKANINNEVKTVQFIKQ